MFLKDNIFLILMDVNQIYFRHFIERSVYPHLE